MSKLTNNDYAIMSGEIAALEELARLGEITDSERSELRRLKKQMSKMTKTRSNYRDEMPTNRVRDDNPTLEELRSAARSYRRNSEDEAFSRYLRSGYVSAEMHMSPEMRADGTGLSTAPNSAGLVAGATGYDAGYMVPQGFFQNLQVALKQYGGLEQDFRIVQTSDGRPMPWPTIDRTNVLGTVMGGEINQISPTNVYQFGQGMLNAWTVVGPCTLASLQLVEDSAFDVDNFVSDRLGESVGRKLAALAYNGTGSAQHLGIATALSSKGPWGGIGTSGGTIQGSVNATVPVLGNTSGIPKLANGIFEANDLLNLIKAVDPLYRRQGAKFYMSDTDLVTVRRLVDGYGRPLFQSPNDGGEPLIFGYPICIDNNITPASTTASTLSGPIFGYLKAAFVYRQVNDVRLLRLTERFADYLSVGYIAYVRGDFRSNDMRAVAGYVSPTS